ncbi:MAG: amino acid-binding protein [Sedimentisphaerales bacterium]
MKLDISRVDVWAASIKDRPGELAKKLDALSQAGANLEFVIARRAPERPGTGVVFVTPIKGAKQIKAAKKAGFSKAASLRGLRVTAVDKPGLGAKLTKQLAEAGINLRGFSGAAIGKRAIFHLAFDSNADASKAMRTLK